MKQKVLYMLMSLLVAFGVWSYVVTVVSPESEATYYNIPVVLTNESVLLEKGLMVTSDTNPSVTLQLRGNRTDLNDLKTSDITVLADLSKINAPGEQLLSCNVSITPNAFEILTQNPSQILLQIAEWSTKEVPVNVYCDTTQMLPNYIAYKDDIVQDYETVTITGPKDVVDLIAEARIDIMLDQSNTQTLNESYRYTLCDENGLPVDAASIKTNAAEVNVTVKIQQVKEIQLLLNVTYGGGTTAETALYTLDQQYIKVAGSDELLEGFDSLVIGSVNMADIHEETVMEFPIKLQEGVENLSGITSVNATITFPGLATKTLDVSKIFVSNTPEGMTYDIATKVVKITVRGPEELIETIEAENLTILIDLSNGELGENLYKAQILVDTAYSDVGAIGNYNVLVTLAEIQEEVE